MKLTLKQEAFALAYIQTGNASGAYRTVYDAGNMAAKTVNETASRLMKNRKVAARVAELRAPALKKTAMSAEKAILEASAIASMTIDEPAKYADKLKALEMMFKHHGIYERDNRQRAENLKLEIIFVGPK